MCCALCVCIRYLNDAISVLYYISSNYMRLVINPLTLELDI